MNTYQHLSIPINTYQRLSTPINAYEHLSTLINAHHRLNEKKTMTLREAQEAVDKWIKDYGVRYFSELTNMACLTEEVGELARVMARTYGDQSFKKGEQPNQTGIDLTEELRKSFDKKTIRDKDRHKNNPKLK